MMGETGRTTWPTADGEMAERVRAHDWAATPLGPVETWPQSLKTMVDLLMANPVANILVCGPERVLIYNDACIALYGDKHPGALGSRGPEAFPELWDEIGPLYDRVFAGEQLRFEAQPWAFDRGAGARSGLYDAFFAPGRDESGQVAFAYVTAVEVTDRMRLAATVRESEERLRFAMNAASLGYWQLDLATMDLSASRHCKENFGYPSDAPFSYETLISIIHPDDRERQQQAVSAAVADNRELAIEYRIMTPDGDQRYIHVQGRASYAPDGTPLRIQGISENITDRKRVEIALRESEERQAFLLELSDRMREARDAEAVIAAATRMLGERLNASRIVFAEIDDAAGAANIRSGWTADGAEAHPAILKLTEFGGPLLADLRAGRTVRYDDVGAPPHARPDLAALAAIGIGAGLSVPLLIGGRFVVNLNVHQHEPRTWTDAEVALVEEVAERIWSAVERARVEAALGESEEKYRTLFEAMDQGFCTVEVIFDGEGRAVDYAFLEMNPAFKAQTGLENAAGKRMRDLAPAHEEFWFETYGRIARSGRAERFEHRADALERWFDVFAFPVGDPDRHRVAILFQDIALRKRAEEALQESEERQAFLLKLSDTLRPLADPPEIQRAALRIVGKHLGIDRMVYAEMETDDAHFSIAENHVREGFFAMTGRFSTDTFGPLTARLRAGETVAIADVETSELTGEDLAAYRAGRIASLVGVPLVKRGRWLSNLSAHMGAPRMWREDEVVLLQETAERTWAAVERARAEAALRESQAALAHELANTRQLQAISGLLIESQDDEALYGRLLDAAMAIMRADFASLQRFDAEARELRLLAHRNFHPDSVKFWDRVSISTGTTCGGALREGERLVALDVAAYDPDGREHYRLCGMSSVQSTPLTARDGRLIGMLSTHWRQPFTPDEADFRSLDILARQTADAFERSRAEAALRESEERFRQFGEASSDVLWIRSAETLQWEYLSNAFDAIYGEDRETALAGNDLRRWAEMILPEDREQALANIRRVFEGKRVTFEYRIRRPSDGQIRWLRNTDFPLLDEAGQVQRIGGIGHDATDEKELSDRLQVLVAELQHRTHNLIAVIQSLSHKTRKESVSLDDFQARFSDRLMAVSRVQGLLSRLGEGQKITFEELLRAELSALGALDGHADRVTLEGPAGVRLRSGTVQTFALALHELATNAVKYGALSSPDGHLVVRWHVETNGPESRLHVEWRESGVAMPEADAAFTGSGYGRELIERALPYQLKAKTTYEIGPDGVRCTIAVPTAEAFPQELFDA